jgi:hypothetical protein
LLALSEGDGSPSADPFGHIHGRRYTLDRPGFYTLGLRVVDTSTHGHGTEGAPHHSPSDLFHMYVQAGMFIPSISKTNDQVTVAFPGRPERAYSLEYTPVLEGTNTTWTAVDGPVGGLHGLHSFRHEHAIHRQGFYRIRETTP